MNERTKIGLGVTGALAVLAIAAMGIAAAQAANGTPTNNSSGDVGATNPAPASAPGHVCPHGAHGATGATTPTSTPATTPTASA